MAGGSRAGESRAGESRAGAGGSSSAPGLVHLRALDGLRGIAVLAVVLYHFSPDIAPGGFLGVDIFFLLSGFLITSLLVNEWDRSRTVSLLRFWIRRARRLLPALFMVLVVVAVSTLFMSDRSDGHRIGIDGLSAFGYVANWRFIASGQSYVEQLLRSAPSPLRHTWSLAIEEQFYLLWPLVVFGVGAIVRRRAGRNGRGRAIFRRSIVAVCVVLGVLSFLRMITLFDGNGGFNRVYYGTDSHAFLLLLGAAIGAVTAGAPAIARRAPRIAIIVVGSAAAVVVGVAAATVDTVSSWLYEGGYGVIAILIALVLLAATQPGPNPLARLCSTRPLVGLGLISYGVYLWHWPAVVWLTEARTGLDGPALFAVRSVVTLAVSLASYTLVEQPIRRGRVLPSKRTTTRFAVLGLTCLVAILVTIPVVALPSAPSIPTAAPSEASRRTATGYAAATRCHAASTTKHKPTGTGPRVELAGNSVATEIVSCLSSIVEAKGGELVDSTKSAAPPCTLLPGIRAKVTDPRTRPDIAIWFAFDWYRDAATCNRNWLDQVNEAIRIWTEAGTRIYLVPIVPNVVPSRDPAIYEVKNNGFQIDAPAQLPDFLALAAKDPARITVVDAGAFIRDANGVYQWRMPCLPGGERGCANDKTIGVRWTDGFHFCTDPKWTGTDCGAVYGGGERRVAAAIAARLPL